MPIARDPHHIASQADGVGHLQYLNVSLSLHTMRHHVRTLCIPFAFLLATTTLKTQPTAYDDALVIESLTNTNAKRAALAELTRLGAPLPNSENTSIQRVLDFIDSDPGKGPWNIFPDHNDIAATLKAIREYIARNVIPKATSPKAITSTGRTLAGAIQPLSNGSVATVLGNIVTRTPSNAMDKAAAATEIRTAAILPGGTGTTSIIGGLTGIDFQSAVLSGLTSVITDRFKEELTIAFFERFRKALDDDATFKSILPRTHQLLASFSKLNFPSNGSTWRAAFEADLRELPQKALSTLVKKQDDPKIRLAVALFLGTERLMQGAHPVEVLAYIDAQNAPSTEFEKVLHALIGVLGELHSQSGAHDWLSVTDIRNMSATAAEYWVALLKHKHRSEFENIAISGSDPSTTLYQYLGKNNWQKWYTYSQSLVQAVDRLQGVVTRLLAVPESEKAAAFLSLGNVMLDVVDLGMRLGYIGNPGNYATSGWVKDQLPIARRVVEIGNSIVSRTYGGAIINTLWIVDQIGADATKSTTIKHVLHFTTFITDLLAAKTEDDVQHVIETATLPAGSFSIKRHCGWSVAINSYAGASLGWENGTGDDAKLPSQLRSFHQVAGFAAPVGFELSHSTGKDAGGSVGLFFSVIDLGALVNFRLSTQDSVSTTPEVGFQQVFSPGAYLVFGLGELPLTLGIGARYNPALREVKASQDADGKLTSANRASVFQINLFLAVDIPLFLFFGGDD
jgi:hypothetical protein